MTNMFPKVQRHVLPIEFATQKKEQNVFNNISLLVVVFGFNHQASRARKTQVKFWAKAHFFGYVPHTTCSTLWYDLKIYCVKITTHTCFDEAVNDLPVS